MLQQSCSIISKHTSYRVRAHGSSASTPVASIAGTQLLQKRGCQLSLLWKRVNKRTRAPTPGEYQYRITTFVRSALLVFFFKFKNSVYPVRIFATTEPAHRRRKPKEVLVSVFQQACLDP